MLRLIRKIRRWWRGDVDPELLVDVRDRRDAALDTRAEHAFRDATTHMGQGPSGS